MRIQTAGYSDTPWKYVLTLTAHTENFKMRGMCISTRIYSVDLIDLLCFKNEELVFAQCLKPSPDFPSYL